MCLRRCTTRWFGAGATQGGVKKVVTPTKFSYSNWALDSNTRGILDSIYHPFITEYFMRLQKKYEFITAKQNEHGSMDDAVVQLKNKDGSNFVLSSWNKTYRDDLETAEKFSLLIRKLESNSLLRDQTLKAQKNSDDAELLLMVEDDIKETIGEIRALEADVGDVIAKRLRTDDSIGNCTNMWNVNVVGKAGGEEATLFAMELADLFKTYSREVHDWKVEDITESDDGMASGLGSETGASKGTQIRITGEDVYRYFHHEIGVHKVQRVPVTDQDGKMQTSTAVVTMMPVLDPVSVNVHECDCKIDFVRGSGPGGQGMQSSSNACVLTHKPSGITVKCHQSRSALGNKELALQTVAQQLLAQRVKDQNLSLYEAWKNQWSSGERSDKMRTYNFPQNRVTDHRLGKDFALGSFMGGGSTLKGVHDELNAIDEIQQLCTVLLKHIEADFASKIQ